MSTYWNQARYDRRRPQITLSRLDAASATQFPISMASHVVFSPLPAGTWLPSTLRLDSLPYFSSLVELRYAFRFWLLYYSCWNFLYVLCVHFWPRVCGIYQSQASKEDVTLSDFVVKICQSSEHELWRHDHFHLCLRLNLYVFTHLAVNVSVWLLLLLFSSRSQRLHECNNICCFQCMFYRRQHSGFLREEQAKETTKQLMHDIPRWSINEL
jgi:hypothetical protein